jgi:hypothetical protein
MPPPTTMARRWRWYRRCRATSFVPVVLVAFLTLLGTPALAQTTEEEEGSFYIRTYSPNEGTHCTVGPYVEGQGEVGPYGWFCVPSNIKYSYSEYDPTVIDETGGTADETEVDECAACATCRDDCARGNQTETEYEACVRTNAAVCIPDDCHDDQQRLKMEACKQPFELCVAKFHEFLASDAKASTGYVYEFYVSSATGDDDGTGSRTDPWKTLARAKNMANFLKNANGGSLAKPVQVWVREDSTWNPSSELETGRYASITWT